ncbi:hypothetical protein N9251_03070 [Gammaproteobacteria bacterium]|nr:hypothetical protein [Gammaproteobacteria bacterium]
MKLIKPPTQIMEVCRKFAEQSAASSMDEYARRNQHSIDKIKLDIFRGKVAEFQVWQHLVDRARDVVPPDVAIYDKYHKTFDADLVCNGQNLHVKSHMRNPQFPVSWVFQKRDKLTYAPSDNDWLCLVTLEADFSGTLYIRHAKEVTFEQPKKESLRASKVCVYERGLS